MVLAFNSLVTMEFKRKSVIEVKFIYWLSVGSYVVSLKTMKMFLTWTV